MDIENTTIYEQFELHALQIEDHGCSIHKKFLVSCLRLLLPGYGRPIIEEIFSKDEFFSNYDGDKTLIKYNNKSWKIIISKYNKPEQFEINICWNHNIDNLLNWKAIIIHNKSNNLYNVYISKNEKAEIPFNILAHLAYYDIMTELLLQRNNLN